MQPIRRREQLSLSWISFSLKTLRLSPFGLAGVGFSRLWNPPSFHSGVCPTAVINYFALYSEAGSLPRLKLRTAYAFFRSSGLCPSGSSSCRRDANRAVQGRVPFRVKSAARVEFSTAVTIKGVVAPLVGKA